MDNTTASSKNTMILILSNNAYAQILSERLLYTGYQVKIHTRSLSTLLIKRVKPELVVCYDYAGTLNETDLEKLHDRLIAIHTSFLPFNKGAHPNLWSIINNTPQGVTIYKPERDIWDGKILFQREVPFNRNTDTLTSTYRKLHQAAVDLFVANIDTILSGEYEAREPLPGGSFHNLYDVDRFLDGRTINYDMTINEFADFISDLEH